MKTLLMAPYPPMVGGIAKWAMTLCHTKLPNNWEVIPFQTNTPGSEVYNKIDKRNYLHEVKRCFWIWKRLNRTLKADKEIQIVHTNIPANFQSMLRECICAIIVKLNKRKFIVHFHCTLPQKVQSRPTLLMLKILCGLSENAITLNKQSLDYLQEQSPKTKSMLLPNFVEDDIIRCTEKKFNKMIRTVLYVGGIVEIKGCNDILKVAEIHPNIEFRMVGFISQEFKNRVIPKNVVLTGVKQGKELEEEYNNADIFIFLSHMNSEGFSIALTEAMAYGLPCIVTDWAANKDMIGKEGGIVIPILSPEKAAEAIDLLQNEEIREKASARNIETVRRLYSQSVIAGQLVNIYETVIMK